MRFRLAPTLLTTTLLLGCGAAAPEPQPAPPPITGAVASVPPVEAAPATGQKNEPVKSNAATKNEPAGALGALTGDQVGNTFGARGLGLAGVGEGGGGLGTIGHGAGTGQGYGSGAGRAGGGSSTKGQVKGATAATTGTGLPKEVIQRIVRQHVSQIHSCYDTAMQKAPTLAGKLAVSFTIDAKGAVASASAGDTTISDAEMVTCVVNVLKRMTFPAPEGGSAVQVTYPFIFSPNDS
jgi:hypothetical protein